MSVHYTSYQRECDICGTIHPAACSSPRRALSAARRDGWQRVNLSPLRTRKDGSTYHEGWSLSDVCAACLDAMESEPKL